MSSPYNPIIFVEHVYWRLAREGKETYETDKYPKATIETMIGIYRLGEIKTKKQTSKEVVRL